MSVVSGSWLVFSVKGSKNMADLHAISSTWRHSRRQDGPGNAHRDLIWSCCITAGNRVAAQVPHRRVQWSWKFPKMNKSGWWCISVLFNVTTKPPQNEPFYIQKFFALHNHHFGWCCVALEILRDWTRRKSNVCKITQAVWKEAAWGGLVSLKGHCSESVEVIFVAALCHNTTDKPIQP